MTATDHATHALSARIRALADTRPRKSLIDALAVEAVNLERRLELAEERIAHLLEDDGTEAEAPSPVQAPVAAPVSADERKVFMHG